MSYLCEKCANKNCQHEIEPGEIVVQCGAFKKPMTNADRIRAMTDKELTEFIGHNSLCDRIQGVGTWCDERAVCENCLTVWLQQPVEEVDHGTE